MQGILLRQACNATDATAVLQHQQNHDELYHNTNSNTNTKLGN